MNGNESATHKNSAKHKAPKRGYYASIQPVCHDLSERTPPFVTLVQQVGRSQALLNESKRIENEVPSTTPQVFSKKI